MLRALFDHHMAQLGDEQAVIDWLAGMTDRYAIREFEQPVGAAGVLSMALFTKDTIDRVRDAVDMVHLVSEKTDLRRVGTRWTGLCPFHDERTPSFSVNAEEKLYYCFGCGEGGDAFKFVQQTEGLDFQEAVEQLAERSGVQVEREEDDPRAEQRRRRRDRLHALLDRAARFYATYLNDAGEAAAAREYLASRGLSDEVLAEFRVGYSPSAWDRMLVGAAPGRLQRGGAGGARALPSAAAEAVSTTASAAGSCSRWPTPRGRVLGFGARAMGEGRGPKYLNTSENDLYHKGRQLFGIDVARKDAMKTGRFVVVEGYTDVLALHQAGIRRGRGDHGHGDDPGAARGAGQGGRLESPRHGLPRSRCRSSGPRGDAEGRPAGGGPRSGPARDRHAGGHRSGGSREPGRS